MSEVEAPMLVIREGQLSGQRFLFNRDMLVVGRGSDCDIVLPERQVSRHHVRFLRGDDGYLVEDLGSKNGTFCQRPGARGTGPPAGSATRSASRWRSSWPSSATRRRCR
jgi:hypothetical protein